MRGEAISGVCATAAAPTVAIVCRTGRSSCASPVRRQNLFRDMFVQERLGGANTRIGMKPPPHRVVM